MRSDAEILRYVASAVSVSVAVSYDLAEEIASSILTMLGEHGLSLVDVEQNGKTS